MNLYLQKEGVAFSIFGISVLIFDRIFSGKKDKFFDFVFLFIRGFSNIIIDLLLYLQSGNLRI